MLKLQQKCKIQILSKSHTCKVKNSRLNITEDFQSIVFPTMKRPQTWKPVMEGNSFFGGGFAERRMTPLGLRKIVLYSERNGPENEGEHGSRSRAHSHHHPWV